MRLIITENLDYANSIAYAYTNGRETDVESARIMIGSELSSFIFSREPLLRGGKINPNFYGRLLDKIELLKAEKVTLALNPTRTTRLFTSLLEQALSDMGITVESVTLPTLWKREVISAFEDGNLAVTPNRLRQSIDELTARSKISHAVAKTVSEVAGDGYSNIDASLLCLLSLLSIRSAEVGNPKFRMSAKMQIGDCSVMAASTACYSKDECVELMKTLGGRLELVQNPYVENIISAESLYGALDGSEKINVTLRSTVESLYTKRYISCPYTMSKELPMRMNEKDIRILIKSCRAICAEPEDIDADSLSSVQRAGRNELHAIIPLMHNAGQLEGDERVMYRYIAGQYVEAAKESKTRRALFKSPSGVPFAAEVPEGLSITKRNAKSVAAIFSYELAGVFSYYRPEELIRELTERGLDAADVVFSLLLHATESGTLFVNNGVYLTSKGVKLLESLPVDEKEVINLYTFIESSLHACRKENSGKTPEEIFREVTLKLTSWRKSALENRNAMHPSQINPLEKIEEKELAELASSANETGMQEEQKNPPAIETNTKEQVSHVESPRGAQVPAPAAVKTKSPDAASDYPSTNETRSQSTPAFSATETKDPEEPPEPPASETRMQNAGPKPERKEPPQVPEEPRRNIRLTCPFCRAAAILQNDTEFYCMSCGRSLPYTMKTKCGTVTITEKDLVRLEHNKRTSLKTVLADEEITDRAYIVMTGDGKLGISHTSSYTCPGCGTPLKVHSWGYHCEGCGFSVPFEIYQRQLTAGQVKTLIRGEKTEVIKDLISKDGELFDAALLAKPDGIKLYRK